jgi:organic hydroperoxide reductase OsmC/OhrA
MLGTLNGALEARGISLQSDAMHAAAEGTNELVDGIVTLTRIDVRYTLRIPAGTREAVDRALSRHREKCPTAMSLRGAVAVEWSAEITEESIGA